MVSVDFSILVVLAATLFVLAVMMAFVVPRHIRLVSVWFAIGYGVLMAVVIGVYILTSPPFSNLLTMLVGIGMGIALAVPLAILAYLEKVLPIKERESKPSPAI